MLLVNLQKQKQKQEQALLKVLQTRLPIQKKSFNCPEKLIINYTQKEILIALLKRITSIIESIQQGLQHLKQNLVVTNLKKTKHFLLSIKNVCLHCQHLQVQTKKIQAKTTGLAIKQQINIKQQCEQLILKLQKLK